MQTQFPFPAIDIYLNIGAFYSCNKKLFSGNTGVLPAVPEKGGPGNEVWENSLRPSLHLLRFILRCEVELPVW